MTREECYLVMSNFMYMYNGWIQYEFDLVVNVNMTINMSQNITF